MGENELIKSTMLTNEIVDIVKKCVQDFNKKVDNFLKNSESKPTFADVLGPISKDVSTSISNDLRKDVPYILALYMCVMDTKEKYPEYAASADRYAEALIEKNQSAVNAFLGDDESIIDFTESVIKLRVNTKQEKHEKIESYKIIKIACHIANRDSLVNYFTNVKHGDLKNDSLDTSNKTLEISSKEDEKPHDKEPISLKEAIDYFNVKKEGNILQSINVMNRKKLEKIVEDNPIANSRLENIILSSYYKINSLPKNKFGEFLAALYIRLRLKLMNSKSQKIATAPNLLIGNITKSKRIKMSVSKYFMDTKSSTREVIKNVMDIIKDKSKSNNQNVYSLYTGKDDDLDANIISILKERDTYDSKTYVDAKKQIDEDLQRDNVA